MSSLFSKRILSSCLSTSSSLLQNHHLALLTPLLLSSLSTLTKQRKDVPFVAQYLISALGFSEERALKISSDKKLAQIRSSNRPDSVVRFLKDTGMLDAQIKSAISYNPNLLRLSVDETLKPRAQQLTAAGFDGEILVHLIRYTPFIFEVKDTLSNLQFWRGFVGDTAFPKLIQRNGLLIRRNIDSYITPRMNLLKEYGLSHKGIVALLTLGSRMLITRLDVLDKKLKQTEELGFLRGTNMFVHGLNFTLRYRIETIEKKSQFFQKMYGWSEEDVRLAFIKFPAVLQYSEKKVKATMDFLINDAGLEPRSIAARSILLGYSLEKRLVPRHQVLSFRKTHGLKPDYELFTVAVMSEKTFFERCILPHEKDVPGLAEVYAAACLGKVPNN